MDLKVINSNITKQKQSINKKNASYFPPLNYKNLEINFTGLGSTLSTVGNKLTKSSVHFSDYNIRKDQLNKLFGDEFSIMEKEFQEFSQGFLKFDKKIIFDKNGGVTFVEDGILPKFLKSAAYPFKDLWLDVASWALRGASRLEKVPVLSDGAKNLLNSSVLQKRANAKNAEEIFCIMQGAFSDIASNEKTFNKLANSAMQHIRPKTAQALSGDFSDTPETVLHNMLHAASSVKGNYKTADERTINRICTGLVSATMAGIDFYNISRMQNDDDALAKKSQKKRFKQESSRILMSAGMTFLTLGALSKYANSNKYVALFTIAGTTLISEILSRLMSGMPLRPLKPEEAKDFSYHKHSKKNKNADVKNNEPSQLKTDNQTQIIKDIPDEFGKFVINKKPDENQTQTKFKGSKELKKNDDNGTPLNAKNLLKAFGVLLAAGLGVCFARSRNEKFNSLLKNIRAGMDNAVDLLTKKDYLVPLDKARDMLSNISNNLGLTDFSRKLSTELESDKYAKIIKQVDGKNVEYVKLGRVDKKFVAPIIKAVTYPFGFVWGVIRFPTKIMRGLFEKEASKDLSKINSEDLMSLYKIYDKAKNKLDAGKITPDEFSKLIKRKTIIAAENKTGKSTYKNSSLAAISRPLVTLIASYFFVNDYRNEVLITSHGEDVEGANAVAKERVMHKVSNFFFNSLLMNLFNSVFESAYHGSLIGAGAVAAATEFTNENLIRKSIGVPTKKMSREEIQEHDRQNLERNDFWGKYFRFMSKLTGKKTISQKVQDQEKKKAQKA